MSHDMDLSSLDRHEALVAIFPVVYAPFHLPNDPHNPPPHVPIYPVEVEGRARINCGFWAKGKDYPTILYFHGNGETLAAHDWIAPFYNERGINLFVADYRGYGSSTGRPTVSNTVRDCHSIFQRFKEIINEEGFNRSLFIMGRSLGSVLAVELVFHYHEEVQGLIIESGTANNFRRLWDYMGLPNEAVLGEKSPFLNKVKIRKIDRPTLIIHGECDDIIPPAEGRQLYQNSAAPDKEILIIPGAGHNDILMADQSLYFDTIADFVKRHR